MLEEIILPSHWHLELEQWELEEHGLILHASITTLQAGCPICGELSGRVHSRYTRQPADLPFAGQVVGLRLRMRRFFCDNPACPRRTFAEQLPVLVEPKARRTVRQFKLLQQEAFALGGNPGARLAAKMGIKVSRATLLRIIKKTPLPQSSTPRILGVDDWAKRRGVEYGSILVDLERHCPIDLLADRTAETFAKWLVAHPGVEIISRDRASAYADGGRQGAPQAMQVADRFHLLVNLHDHLKDLLKRKSACLYLPEEVPYVSQAELKVEQGELKAKEETGLTTSAVAETIPPSPQALAPKTAPVSPRKNYLWEEVHRLNQAGLSQRAIARELKCGRRTVDKYLRTQIIPSYSLLQPRKSILDPYKAYLAARWEAGVHGSRLLYTELVERGFRGSRALVATYLSNYGVTHPRKVKETRGQPRKNPVASVKAKARPKLGLRHSVWLLVKPQEELKEEEQQQLNHLRGFDVELEQSYQLSQRFVSMVKHKQGTQLEEWLGQVKQSSAPELKSFGRGIEQDQAAVKAGLTLEISQGQTEGQVNRLKTIKRSAYGRASFELLKARVLYAA